MLRSQIDKGFLDLHFGCGLRGGDGPAAGKGSLVVAISVPTSVPTVSLSLFGSFSTLSREKVIMFGFVTGFSFGVRHVAVRRAVASRSAVRMCASSTGKSPKELTVGEWQAVLNPEQFRVLRMKGTEYPGTGEYDKFYPEEGTFACVGCGSKLYKAKTKFDSGCGWPAFYEGIPGAILEETDADGRRTEILCANCHGHLGHVFKGEGFKTPTNARHCVNSVSLTYKAE